MSETITKQAIVPFSCQQMYELVNDVEKYPQFLPWCKAGKLLMKIDNELKATLTIDKVNLSFSTHNKMIQNERIELKLIDGPFKFMNGLWIFTKLNDNACKIDFTLNFEYKNFLISKTLGPVFNIASNLMVDSFLRRAKEIYK